MRARSAGAAAPYPRWVLEFDHHYGLEIKGTDAGCHGGDVVRQGGAAAVAGVTPRGFRNTDELRDEVRDWCLANSSPARSPSISLIRAPATPPVGLQGSNIVIGSGSAMPSTVARPVDFGPFEAIPSGEYAASDPESMNLIDDVDGGMDEDRDL